MTSKEHTTDRRSVLAALAGAPAFAGTFAIGFAAPAVAATAAVNAWEKALADYTTKRAISDATPLGTPGEDDLVDAYCDAMDYLLVKVPAPDLRALSYKLELAVERCDGFAFDEQYGRAITNDIKALELRYSALTGHLQARG